MVVLKPVIKIFWFAPECGRGNVGARTWNEQASHQTHFNFFLNFFIMKGSGTNTTKEQDKIGSGGPLFLPKQDAVTGNVTLRPNLLERGRLLGNLDD